MNTAFGNHILMMRVHSAVTEFLSVLSDMIDECGSFKDPIVSFVSIHKNAMIKCHFFKVLFRSNSFSAGET